MSVKDCKCGDPIGHAKAVSSAVFTCLLNAMNNPEKESYWRKHADLLESKFITTHGRHYDLVLNPPAL